MTRTSFSSLFSRVSSYFIRLDLENDSLMGQNAKYLIIQGRKKMKILTYFPWSMINNC